MFSINALKAYRVSYMSVHVSLHSINEMTKRDNVRGHGLCNEFNKFKNTLRILRYNTVLSIEGIIS